MTRLDQLTDRQMSVFEFIQDKIRKRGYGPTVREIGDEFKINSPNGVMCHLRALEKKGVITREPNMSRAIRLAPGFGGSDGIPLAGRISAGVIHESIGSQKMIDFGKLFDDDGHFALQVSGSVVDAQIADGDYVVVKRADEANPGQLVLAQADGRTMLKYWLANGGGARLNTSPMVADRPDDTVVVGVVVGVVRHFS